MVNYAILGSTGNCGLALIENLRQSPNNIIHAYCRNESKLQKLVPNLHDTKQIKVFAGNILDVELIANCLRDTQVVFIVVTTNDNIPGCHLGQDSSASVVSALERLREEAGSDFKVPKLVLLSSATIDDHLARKMPGWFRPIMLTAASHVYRDLRLTEDFLRSQEHWIRTIYIKPGGLSLDIARGHQLSLEEEESFISYLDLSAGMIDAALAEGEVYDGKNVAVVNKIRGVGARFPPGTPKCIFMGLMRHFFPWMHPYLPSTGPS